MNIATEGKAPDSKTIGSPATHLSFSLTEALFNSWFEKTLSTKRVILEYA
jgi:hypothetical protein